MNWLFHSYLVSVLELFQSDIKSMVFVHKAAQTLEIVLLDFYLNLYQIDTTSFPESIMYSVHGARLIYET